MPAFLEPAADRCRWRPAVLGVIQSRAAAHQDGGWGRQVTQADFAISTEISGVDMRLEAGGIRELHWHQQAEWAIMTYGHCRVTILDAQGPPHVEDVEEGDLWYFPAGLPHSLQGLAPTAREFVLAFDNGTSSEFNTLPSTDWLAHTPPDILAQEFRRAGGCVQEYSAAKPLDLPGQGARAACRGAGRGRGEGRRRRSFRSTFSLADGAESTTTAAVTCSVADSSNFKVSQDDRGRSGDCEARRLRDDALASQRRRVAILHEGHGRG